MFFFSTFFLSFFFFFFFFNYTATTEIYTLSLHDALPIRRHALIDNAVRRPDAGTVARAEWIQERAGADRGLLAAHDRHVEPRALALADDDVEDLEGRGIGAAVVGNAIQPHDEV